MIRISVVIITLNEERNIGRCLASVKDFADEILVVDSNSTDNTISIAESYGARIVHQPFLGYVKQRIFATEQAKYDWVFTIDADEEVSGELKQSILQTKNNPQYNTYRLSRKTNYCGKWINHSGWYPDKKIRLCDRTKGAWKGELVHEHWEQYGDEPIGDLKGDLFHYSFYTISEHIAQIEKFTEMSARAAVANGKDCSLLKVWLGPKWFFLQRYIFRLGFLDGYYGYLVCKFSAYATMIKYAKIRQYAKLKREGKWR